MGAAPGWDFALKGLDQESGIQVDMKQWGSKAFTDKLRAASWTGPRPVAESHHKMSSFVWMKVLESAPERYDRGIRMLSGGRIEEAYDRIAKLIAAPGKRILDIGCGTGGVTLACAARGAAVTGIDIDAGMLEVARKKPVPASGSVEFLEAWRGRDRGPVPGGKL